MTGNQRAANRVFFEDIAILRDRFVADDLANRVVPVDDWTPPELEPMTLGALRNNAIASTAADEWYAQRPKGDLA